MVIIFYKLFYDTNLTKMFLGYSKDVY
ncbi:uncharacterized protein METZ01_LOCUS370367 [marine metagenome]|uniref:Uncharacterized protein n=1 Tax=marine metagenome TaxID=408172 RepID=A0A382T692_9ZZZZ